MSDWTKGYFFGVAITLWLLALPYVVTISTSPKECKTYAPGIFDAASTTIKCVEWEKPRITYSFDIGDGEMFSCGEKAKNFCYDTAAALNEAHERRMQTLTSEDKDFLERGRASVEEMKALNKEACGQDDCGKEPK